MTGKTIMTKPRVHSLCTDPEWLGRSDCKHCGIRHMMMFADLQDSDFDHILEPIDNFRYAEKTMIYRQNTQDNKVYSIRRGLVKLTHSQADGSLRTVRLLGPGSLLGIESILNVPYHHTAVALQDLDVCRINTATLKRLEIENPSLNEKVMGHWEQNLSTADRWISELSSGPVRSRVLKLFRFLIELSGDKNDTLRFFGYEDMALMIGTSRETFSRIVAELKDEGILTKIKDHQIYRLSLTDE